MAVGFASMIEAGVTAEVEVRGIASGGAGVADLDDGRVVFVPRTAPGDRVRIRLEKTKKRWATGSLVELVQPSTDRIEPSCRYYDQCGGCQLLHLRYETQVEWKERIIEDGLRRIGGVEELPAVRVLPAEVTTGYRSRVSFTLRRLRGGRVVAGFHGLERPGHIVDVREHCLLATAPIREAWQEIRRGWGPGARALPSGARLRLTLREATQGVELSVVGGSGWDPAALLEAAPSLTAVWHKPKGGQPRLVSGEPSPGGGRAFEQVNRSMGARLTEDVLAAIGEPLDGADRLVDAYCGVGVFGRGAAAQGWNALGIEVDSEAVQLANREAPEGFRAERASVEDRLAELPTADVIVLNPPREGVASEALGHVMRVEPACVIYVSCDPATLGRDIRVLSERYEIEAVRGYDLFPQTAHVETVVTLRCRGGDT